MMQVAPDPVLTDMRWEQLTAEQGVPCNFRTQISAAAHMF